METCITVTDPFTGHIIHTAPKLEEIDQPKQKDLNIMEAQLNLYKALRLLDHEDQPTKWIFGSRDGRGNQNIMDASLPVESWHRSAYELCLPNNILHNLQNLNNYVLDKNNCIPLQHLVVKRAIQNFLLKSQDEKCKCTTRVIAAKHFIVVMHKGSVPLAYFDKNRINDFFRHLKGQEIDLDRISPANKHHLMVLRHYQQMSSSTFNNRARLINSIC
eukprot:GHVT01031328.1.p1 GENE.GHVT01031328.1~~GHVT01031328.1.p1  ORF type:complete len:246 (-),score=20.59 GHVT01031328.1:253-903(-)